MHPIIEIFNIRFSSFLLFMSMGVVVFCTFAWFRLRKEEELPRFFFFHLILLISSGTFVGGKLYSVISDWNQFLKNPIDFFFSFSGFGWYGVFLFCIVLMILYFQIIRLPFIRYADILFTAVPLGMIFGRMGCFLAGDACYGIPTDLPWGMSFPNGAIPTYLTVHPAPLYEIFANIIFFVWLIKLNKSKPADGFVMAIYLILYAITRFSLEFIRLSPIVMWGLTPPQIISICLFTAGSVILFRIVKLHIFRIQATSPC